jgi:phage shock protein C
MTLSEELSKLQDLRQRSALTDEEFARAKARVLNDSAAQMGSSTPPPPVAAIKALWRSRRDRWIAGVCAGIARMIGVESWLVRLLFTLLLLCGGVGLLLYVLLWIFVPSE